MRAPALLALAGLASTPARLKKGLYTALVNREGHGFATDMKNLWLSLEGSVS